MNTSIKLGKALTLAALAIVLFVCASEWWVTSHAYPDFGFNNTALIVKTLIAIALFYAVWRGHAWARWLTGAALLLSGLAQFFVDYAPLPWAQWAKIAAVLMVVAGLTVLFSKSIRAFQQYQRQTD
jgi:hypothetical protein